MNAEPKHVSLQGRNHAVTLPDFAAREELVVAYGEARNKRGGSLLRVYAAFLGLCTRLGREAGADYGECRYDALAFGGKVYSYLREKGVTPAQLSEAAIPVVVHVAEATFPRAEEVEAEMGNSEGGEAS